MNRPNDISGSYIKLLTNYFENRTPGTKQKADMSDPVLTVISFAVMILGAAASGAAGTSYNVNSE